MRSIFRILSIFSLCTFSVAFADDAVLALPSSDIAQQAAATIAPTAATPSIPQAEFIPTPPTLSAKGHVLMDFYSGKIISANNADTRMEPASLTKLMTLYISFKALKEGRIHADDKVHISEDAWRMGGSKMFIRVGDDVPVKDLLQGIIVDSGNDACVAMAEFLSGNETSFANTMNQQAAHLGMQHSHFTDSTGMPNADHYTTPQDMAILARAIIREFPEQYASFQQKWFTWNNIRQPNRNRLLWRDPSVDGLKTGHTDSAGYCLVTSATRENMRLISVVMNAPSDALRTSDSLAMLNYGFRFYRTYRLFNAGTAMSTVRVWQGTTKNVPLGLQEDLYVTVPQGSYDKVKASLAIDSTAQAPIAQGASLGTLHVTLNGEELVTRSLIALQTVPEGGLWTRATDRLGLVWHRLFNKTS